MFREWASLCSCPDLPYDEGLSVATRQRAKLFERLRALVCVMRIPSIYRSCSKILRAGSVTQVELHILFSFNYLLDLVSAGSRTSNR